MCLWSHINILTGIARCVVDRNYVVCIDDIFRSWKLYMRSTTKWLFGQPQAMLYLHEAKTPALGGTLWSYYRVSSVNVFFFVYLKLYFGCQQLKYVGRDRTPSQDSRGCYLLYYTTVFRYLNTIKSAIAIVLNCLDKLWSIPPPSRWWSGLCFKNKLPGQSDVIRWLRSFGVPKKPKTPTSCNIVMATS